MSKEEKEVKEKKQQYHLSDRVLAEGYSVKIKSGKKIEIGFDLSLKGEKVSAYASVMEEIQNPARGGGKILKATGITYLEDLTDQELWELAHAGVIILDKSQEKLFTEKFHTKK